MHKNNSQTSGSSNVEMPPVWEGTWESGDAVIHGRMNFALYEQVLTARYVDGRSSPASGSSQTN